MFLFNELIVRQENLINNPVKISKAAGNIKTDEFNQIPKGEEMPLFKIMNSWSFRGDLAKFQQSHIMTPRPLKYNCKW